MYESGGGGWYFLCNFTLEYLWTGQVIHSLEAEKAVENIAQEN